MDEPIELGFCFNIVLRNTEFTNLTLLCRRGDDGFYLGVNIASLISPHY